MSIFEFLIKLFSFVWRMWVTLLAFSGVIVLGIFLIFPLLLISEKNYPFAYRIIRVWAFMVFYGSGFTLKKIDFESWRHSKASIVVSNHTSVIDGLIMFMINKFPIIFIVKAEVGKIPLLGMIAKKICIMVDRSSEKSRKEVFRQVKAKVSQGYSICIFPEGLVPDDESIVLAPFKKGAFGIAIRHQLPLAIFAIRNLKRLFPFDNFRGRPGRVDVEFIEIRETKDLKVEDAEQLNAYTFSKIKTQLNE